MASKVNIELQLESTWFKTNKLSLNLVKTNFIFRSHRKLISDCRPNLNINIDNITIAQLVCAKFLGVHVDDLLHGKNTLIL